jgi:hypothetical protein
LNIEPVKDWLWKAARGPMVLSAFEALFVLVMSNIFLLFLVFVHLVSTPDATLSISLAIDVITNAVSATEVFVYIMALIAPTLWVMCHRWRARRHPIIYFALLLVQIAIMVGSAYIYGKAKTGAGLIENPAFVNHWATVCYIAGVLIWYISLVYDKVLSDTRVPPSPPSGENILNELRRAP